MNLFAQARSAAARRRHARVSSAAATKNSAFRRARFEQPA
jgi:hypothetical protein